MRQGGRDGQQAATRLRLLCSAGFDLRNRFVCCVDASCGGVKKPAQSVFSSQQSSCTAPQGGGCPDSLTGIRALAGCFTRPQAAHLTAQLPGCPLHRPCSLSAHQSQSAVRPLVQPPPSQILSHSSHQQPAACAHLLLQHRRRPHRSRLHAARRRKCARQLQTHCCAHNSRQGQPLTLLLPAAPCAPWPPFGSAASPSPPVPAAC